MRLSLSNVTLPVSLIFLIPTTDVRNGISIPSYKGAGLTMASVCHYMWPSARSHTASVPIRQYRYLCAIDLKPVYANGLVRTTGCKQR